MVSHASIPIAVIKNDSILRIYFGTRDKKNRSHITFIEVNPENPKNISYIHNEPVLSPGELGCFDDSGSMPSCIVKDKNKLYLYYIGWNIGGTVPFRNAIGLAISKDDGMSFERFSKGPILDRSIYEPYFTASSFVIKDNKTWKMWYLSATKWILIYDKPEPLYYIRYATSDDGIIWTRDNNVAINYKFKNEAISRPFILKKDKINIITLY